MLVRFVEQMPLLVNKILNANSHFLSFFEKKEYELNKITQLFIAICPETISDFGVYNRNDALKNKLINQTN